MEQFEKLPLNYLKDESYVLIGSFYEVYNTLGCGFLEEVYQEDLEMELRLKNIPFISQQNLQIQYKGKPLQHSYKPDLICFNQIIVELKAVSILIKEYEAQLHNYLKATGFRLGFLVNLGHYPKLELKRIVR